MTVRNRVRSCIILLSALAVLTTSSFAFDSSEHRLLADSAFADVLQELGDGDATTLVTSLSRQAMASLLQNRNREATFGNLVAIDLGKDLSGDRLHHWNRTVLAQLREISSEAFEQSWQRAKSLLSSQESSPQQISRIVHPSFADNTISRFTTFHLLALRMAAEGGSDSAQQARAFAISLSLEALAQGYLADAFSSGHMVLPWHDFPLHSFAHRNITEAHRSASSHGIYVLNAHGDAWQAFGDNLLMWYEWHYRRTQMTCRVSLRELLLVFMVKRKLPVPSSLLQWLEDEGLSINPSDLVSLWLSANDGEELFSTQSRPASLPSLMYIPVPIAAGWAISSGPSDSIQESRRFVYPQLREIGLHDPDLNEGCVDRLWSSDDVPAWMIPAPLRQTEKDTATEMITHNTRWASVEFYSHNPPKSSWLGLHMSSGGIFQFPSKTFRSLFGVGFTMRVGLIPITLRAGYQPKLSTEHRRVISATVGIALPIPLKFVPLCPPDGICFEAGWLRATQGKRRGHGSMMTFGAFWQLEDRIDRIGVRLQVQYSVMRRHDYVPHGLNANLIFH